MSKPTEKSLQLLKTIPSLNRVKWLILVMLIVTILLLALIPWQQTASGSGRVIAYSATQRQQPISALVEGRIGKWYVQEGMAVKKGDKIAEILDNDPAVLSNLQSEKAALSSRLSALQAATATSKRNVLRQQALYQKGISAQRTLELAQIEFARYESDEATVKAELARIDVRIARQKRQIITAPMNGMIIRRQFGEGASFVKVGDVLAVLVPETLSPAVELWIDGNDIPLIHIGQEVRLQFEGWPAIQFSGWPSVAVGTFGGVVQVVDNADNGEGMFRVLVVPQQPQDWPAARYLRQGVRAHGWILLSQVKLGYELWRQFNGFPPSLDKPI
jgi:multidrug resistance efflux pump